MNRPAEASKQFLETLTNFDRECRGLLKLGVVRGSALLVADVWPPAPDEEREVGR